MLDEVRRFIRRERLLDSGEPVLAAVSGGVDSMVMLHVLRELGHVCSVVHVEHGLRGQEGEEDRAFVEEQCRKLGASFRFTRVDAAAHASEKGLSLQVAARELRYAFINGVSAETGLKVAMAHHGDDAVETMFIHLLRGTGSHGWSAIKPRSGRVVRPLLCVDRASIETFAQTRGIPFREDSSNAESKYLRNRIRHELVPMLEQLRPGARRSLRRSVAMLRELGKAAEIHTMAELAGILPSQDGRMRIPFERIEGSTVPDLLLHELLAGHGFHPDAIERMRDAITDRSTGATFSSVSHQATVDRSELILGPVEAPAPSCTIDPDSTIHGFGPFHWQWTAEKPLSFPTSGDDVLLDVDRLAFPMELRPWRPGDRMRPIGLGGSKLISDILIDAKVPRIDKPGCYVLVSNGQVVWLAGHRIGEGYEASSATRQFLRIWKA